MMIIRPFKATDEEYEAVVALRNLVWSDEKTNVERMKHGDETWDPERFYQRVVMEEQGEIVAYGWMSESPWSHVPGKYRVNITVHPDRRREGLASQLYEWMLRELEGRDPAPVRLTSDTREDREGALAMLQKHAFSQIMRGPISTLDVNAFDFGPFEERAHHVRDGGIEILALPELIDRIPDWERRLYDLDWELEQDVPHVDPPVRQSFERWRQQLLEGPSFLPDAIFVALDGERWVGISALYRWNADPTVLSQGLTGVARSHRRRGIAIALKLETIRYARDAGVETIQTDNEENNPMFDLNLKLGFQPQPAWLDFERPWEGAMSWLA